MKVRALLDGWDGKEHYEPGDEISAVPEHCKMLLINGAAEPVDSEAKKFCHDCEEMTTKEKENHPLFNSSIAANAENISVEETVKPRRKATKSKKRTK